MPALYVNKMSKWLIPELEGIDLQDSFVLWWGEEGGNLIFEIEASIWPGSAFYTSPKYGDYTCYRRMRLMFIEPKNIEGLNSLDLVSFTKDLDGSKDYGNIDALSLDGGVYSILGDFGNVQIHCGAIKLELHE